MSTPLAHASGRVAPPRGERAPRVLLIASAFPPVGGPGVQRPAKFAKYLARLGWDVTVWTAGAPDGLPMDDTLLDDLPPEVDVRCFPPHRRAPGRSGSDAARPRRARRMVGVTRCFDGLRWRLRRVERSLRGMAVPDERLGWAVRSTPRLRRWIHRHGADVIHSTYSPPSNHLLAWALKRSTGVPWVADFRDLWTDDCAYVGGSWLRRTLDRALERRFVWDADAVTAVSDAQARILSEHDPDRRDKFVTITNGFDPDDFAAAAPPRRGDAFVLAHVGQMQSSRVDGAFVEGLSRFVRRLGTDRGRFEFRMVGRVSDELRARFVAAGVRPVVTGYVPHASAIRQMRAADVLLLPTPIGNNAASLIPGKLFEYLASGRPILVVGPVEGEPWSVVARAHGGVRCDRDATAIATTLWDLWRRWKDGRPPPGAPPDGLTPFTRETLTRRLITVFNRVRAKHAPCPGSRGRNGAVRGCERRASSPSTMATRDAVRSSPPITHPEPEPEPEPERAGIP